MPRPNQLASIAEDTPEEDPTTYSNGSSDPLSTLSRDSSPYLVGSETVVHEFFTEDDKSESLLPNKNAFYAPLSRATSRASIDSVVPFFRKSELVALPLAELCDVIGQSQSLEQAKILSVECYSEWTMTMVKHRFLIFHLKRVRRPEVYLRVDRRAAIGASISDMIRGRTDANDTAKLAPSKANLLGRKRLKPDNQLSFPMPPTLGKFRFFLEVICEELLHYQVWPQNCWFFCSLLQEHLVGSSKGTVDIGNIPYPKLARKIRTRIYERVYRMVQPRVTLVGMLLEWDPPTESKELHRDVTRLLQEWNEYQYAGAGGVDEGRFLDQLCSQLVQLGSLPSWDYRRSGAGIPLRLLSEAAKMRRDRGASGELLAQIVGPLKAYCDRTGNDKEAADALRELVLVQQEYAESLIHLGRETEAVLAAQEAVNMCHTAYRQDSEPLERSGHLAQSLRTLRVCLSVAHRAEDAVHAVPDATGISRSLRDKNFPGKQPSYSISLPPVLTVSSGKEHARFYNLTTSDEHWNIKSIVDHRTEHIGMALHCFNIMSENLHENMGGVKNPFIAYSDILGLEHRIPAYIAYACQYWASHLRASDSTDELLTRCVERFVSKQLLWWIEACCVLKSIKIAIEATQDAMVWARTHCTTNSEYTMCLLNDAHCLMLAHSDALQHNPLQLYATALPFAPTTSQLCSTYEHVRLSWSPEVISGKNNEWTGAFAELTGHTAYITSVAFSLDGLRIVSGSYDKTVRTWDVTSGDCTTTLKGHTAVVTSVAFSSDGLYVVSGSGDKTVRIWDTASGDCTVTFKGHTSYVESAAFSSEGLHVVSGSWDKTVRIWDAKTGDCTATLKGHTDNVESVAYSSDGLHVVSGSSDRTVRIWDVKTGDCTATLKGHTHTVVSVAFSSDGLHVVSGSYDKTVRIWDTASGDCTATLKGHTEFVTSVAFSSDGLHVGSSSQDETVRIWDTATGDCTATIKGHTEFVNSVAFSSDGLHVVSGSHDMTVRIWDRASGDCTATLKRHDCHVASVAFSPDGLHVVSVSGDQTVRIWDAKTGDCTATLKGHTDTVLSAAFSSDGFRVVSGSFDGTVRIWDATSGECLQLHENTHNITPFLHASANSAQIKSNIPHHEPNINTRLRFIIDKGWLCLLGIDGKTTQLCLLPIRFHHASCPFEARGTLMCTGGLDGVVLIMDISRLIRRLPSENFLEQW